MNDEIKEILEQLEWYKKIGKKDIMFPEHLLTNKKAFLLLDYITNLQQENEILAKRNNELKNIKDERFYNLQQENERLKEENNNKAMNDYAHAIDESWYRELYDDYKSRCEKADNQLKIIMQIIKEQPTRNIEDDEWLENRLIAVVNILQNGGKE